ncbi:hypothetical protein ACFWXK_01095 [Streptomyces sp. NPDC059070]|uniref:hypothetical protein n=1 Tax=Streptomyces sp. NPDC059070 TaxID=3346713 RepID=UPI0036B1FB94
METRTTGDAVPAEAITLLEALLASDTPLHHALRAQIPHLQVMGRCSCSCATLDLGLDETLVAAAPVTDTIVADTEVLDADGQEIGGVLVFAHGGYLSYLEIYTWLDEPITRFPSPDRLS